ncbi:MAG: type II secretion system F family protein [Patescibacteria group bacterium]
MNNATEKPVSKKLTIEERFQRFLTRRGSIKVQDKINFARHLAMVIKAGLPIYEGLRIIRAQTESKTLARILDHLITDVNNGRFLADGLEDFEHIFGGFFINIIRVGEASGTLSQNLLYLATELRKTKELQSKVRSAMVYPIVILIATIGVVAFLAFFILPKLLPVLYGLKVKLPASTRALLAVVDFIQTKGLYTLIALVVIFYIFRTLMRHIRPLRYALHRAIFFVPVISGLVVSINMVTFARVLAMLLKSGVKIVESVNITRNTFTNLVYKKLLDDAGEEIRKGGQLATVLMAEKHLFPPLLSGMIQVGENTGNLEDNLFYVSEYYDDEVDNKLRSLTSVMEPIMLLIMGLAVGFVAISIITPIYSLSQSVNG